MKLGHSEVENLRITAMKASSIPKGVLNVCRNYWQWANRVADNHKIPENKLNEMVQKGRFKTPEEAEHFTRRSIKTGLVVLPFIAFAIFVQVISSGSEESSVVVQNSDNSTPTQVEATEQTPQPTRVNRSSQDFKTFLPAQDEALKSFILGDAWLNGFLGNVWIGYATRDELLNKGFYVNTLYKHTGEGTAPTGEAKGACSPIGFDGAFMCGQGGIQDYQWGIQNDEAIQRLNILEEQW